MKTKLTLLILSFTVLFTACKNKSDEFLGVYISKEKKPIVLDKNNIFFSKTRDEYNLIIIEKISDKKFKVTSYDRYEWDNTRVKEDVIFDMSDDGSSLNYKNGEVQIVKTENNSISIFFNGKSELYSKTVLKSTDINKENVGEILINGVLANNETKTKIVDKENISQNVDNKSDFDFSILIGREEIGLLESKPIKFVFTNATDKIIEGYDLLLNEKNFTCETIFDEEETIFSKSNITKRPVKGTYTATKKPSGEGFDYWEIEVALNEPGTDEWDGKFEFKFDISDQWSGGSGIWKSFNGKLTRKVQICER